MRLGIDPAVRPGEPVALMGRNGSGKTTLLRTLLGCHRPERGRVVVAEQAVGRVGPAAQADTVGYVPQDATSILFAETLRDELLFTRRYHRRGHPVEATLAALGVAGAEDRHPRDFSGGERERAALAAVLVGALRVLLRDEPSRGMAARAKRALADTLPRLWAEGVAVVLVTHDVAVVTATVTRVVLLSDGTIVAGGGPGAVLSGSLAFATRVNKLDGDGFLTVADVLVGLRLAGDGSPGLQAEGAEPYRG